MSNTEIDGVRYFRCCLCTDFFEGWGNNPDPVRDTEGEYFNEDEECCNECNTNKVMPARFKEMGLG